MTTRKYSSRSQQTTLSSPITDADLTMTVGTAASLIVATVPSTQTFTVVIDPDTALEEIVDVTNWSSGNTLTIARGIDGSSPASHSAGAVVRHMAIGRDYREANQHIESTTTAHGITLANIVKTTDTNVITAAMLQANSVTTAKITDANVTTAKIADSAITSAKIADLTIATGDIADLAITTGKLADGAVTSAKIVDGSIDNVDISATAAIAKTKLNLGGTITSADLVDGTIVASDIADGTITAAKMVTDPYARANHTGTQTASTISNFDTQVRTSTLNQMAVPTTSLSVNSQKITSLATPTLDADAATKLYVDTKVADLINSAPGTLDTLGEIATAIQAGGTVYDSFVLKSGSTMTGALTLSGAPSSNLHAATKAYVDTVAGSATAAAASAADAATTYDNFDDRYLGAKSTAPSVDNDGNALITGALYWNSVSATMFVWTGSAWGSISSTAAIYRYRYTATGGETTKSGADDNGLTLSYITGKEQVYLNGLLLVRNTDYVASSGVSITSLAALAVGDVLEIITFTAFDLATAIDKALFVAKGDVLVATAAGTPGKLSVGTNGQYLQADSTTATGLKWSAVSGYSAPTLGSTSIASGATVTTIAGLTLTSPTVNDPKINLAFDAETASYTAVLANNGQVVTMDNASANTFSIPTNASVAFPVGTQINVLQIGAGQTTIQAVTSGTTTVLSTGGTAAAPKLRARYSMATCIKSATDTWYVIGDIA